MLGWALGLGGKIFSVSGRGEAGGLEGKLSTVYAR